MESLSEHSPLSRYEPAPLQFVTRLSWYPWLVVGVTCIGGFIGQLDASIVQLALPTFEQQFDANLDAVSWVAIAYLLAFASALPVFARWSEIKGRKLLYLAGYAIFTLASGLMRDGVRSAIAHRVPSPPRYRWRSVGSKQHHHPGESRGSRQTGPGHGTIRGGPGSRH